MNYRMYFLMPVLALSIFVSAIMSAFVLWNNNLIPWQLERFKSEPPPYSEHDDEDASPTVYYDPDILSDMLARPDHYGGKQEAEFHVSMQEGMVAYVILEHPYRFRTNIPGSNFIVGEWEKVLGTSFYRKELEATNDIEFILTIYKPN